MLHQPPIAEGVIRNAARKPQSLVAEGVRLIAKASRPQQEQLYIILSAVVAELVYAQR